MSTHDHVERESGAVVANQRRSLSMTRKVRRRASLSTWSFARVFQRGTRVHDADGTSGAPPAEHRHADGTSRAALADLELAPERRARTRSASSRAHLVVRRAHLYLGLVLLPFVALYGATALLFNHSSWFRAVDERALDRDAIASSKLAALTRDAQAAARAIAPPGIEPRDARWEGAWSFESRAGGRVERFEVDALARGGRVRAWDDDPSIETPLAARVAPGTLPGWSDPVKAAAEIAPELGLRAESLAQKRAPRLAFTFDHDGRALLARFDPANGSLRVSPAGERDTLDFLQTLHVAHGSPGFVDSRWWWSWIVDAMGVAMLVWAATGLWLWWSIRAVRKPGVVALALAVAIATALTAGMLAAIPQ